MTRALHKSFMLFPALVLTCAAAQAASGYGSKNPAPAHASAKAGLDTNAIHKLYLDGDFDQAILKLEAAESSGAAYTHQDSVFIFKHLGVMYAAKYETREKGKIYMMRLLQVEPTARIMDMYASDMIYMIFKNIQDEFEVTQVKLKRAKDHVDGNAQSAPVEHPKKVSETPKTKPESHAWIGWTLGTAAAAGGAALLIYMSEGPKVTTREHVIP